METLSRRKQMRLNGHAVEFRHETMQRHNMSLDYGGLLDWSVSSFKISLRKTMRVCQKALRDTKQVQS